MKIINKHVNVCVYICNHSLSKLYFSRFKLDKQTRCDKNDTHLLTFY